MEQNGNVFMGKNYVKYSKKDFELVMGDIFVLGGSIWLLFLNRFLPSKINRIAFIFTGSTQLLLTLIKFLSTY